MNDFTTVHFSKKWMSISELAKEMSMSRPAIWKKVKKESIEVKWRGKDAERPYSMWLINTDKFSEYINNLNLQFNK